MRLHSALPLVGAAAAWIAIAASRGPDPEPVRGAVAIAPSRPGVPPRPEGSPESCSSGCGSEPASIANAPAAEELAELLAAHASEPLGEATPALEALLFHAEATRAHLETRGAGGLDASRLVLLERELARTEVVFEARIVDAEGVERVRLEPSRIPLGVKQHLHADEVVRFQPPVIAGRVERVGLHHLWTRW